MPWFSCPNSFAKYLSQIFLFGPLTKCLYSWATPEILWVTKFASLGFGNCAVNAYRGQGVLLPLDLKLEMGPPVYTLGGCALFTLGDGIRTSGGIICVPDGYLCTLCWKFAGSFPSSYPMTLGFGGVIYLVCPGCSVLVITAAYCSACCCGGSAVLFPSSSALVYILDSFSIATNWGFPMFGNGAWGAWFFKAWANYRAAMVAFSVEYL